MQSEIVIFGLFFSFKNVAAVDTEYLLTSANCSHHLIIRWCYRNVQFFFSHSKSFKFTCANEPWWTDIDKVIFVWDSWFWTQILIVRSFWFSVKNFHLKSSAYLSRINVNASPAMWQRRQSTSVRSFDYLGLFV